MIPKDQKRNWKGCGPGRRGYHHGGLKDALVEAARALMAEHGPAGFTLAEAAKRVGVTNAAPYRHFADRSDLMGELARRGFDMFAERLAGAWDEGKPDAYAALRRMGRAYLGFAAAEPGLYTAMFDSAKNLRGPAAFAVANKAFEGLSRAAALWSFAYFFMLLAGYYVIRPLRDEMAIAGGIRNLPWLFTATFLTLLAAQPLYGALVARLPRAINFARN